MDLCTGLAVLLEPGDHVLAALRPEIVLHRPLGDLRELLRGGVLDQRQAIHH